MMRGIMKIIGLSVICKSTPTSTYIYHSIIVFFIMTRCVCNNFDEYTDDSDACSATNEDLFRCW